MKKGLFLAGAFALAAGFLSGCYSVNTVQNANSTAVRQSVADARVVWDNTLNGKLVVGQIIEATAAGDLRRIQVPLANNYAYALDFMVQVSWYDQSGMLVKGPVDGWKRVQLQAHESTELSFVAITPECRDFKLKFQEAKGSSTIF